MDKGEINMINVKCPKCGNITTIKAVKLEKRIDELEKEIRMLRDANNLKRQCGGIFNDIFG